jgi:hypothetical protein
MPKMIGATPTEIARELGIPVDADTRPARTQEALRPAPGEARVTLNTLRAMARAGLVSRIRAVLSATDRGGPRCLAKRWWAWYVPADALAAYRADHPLRVKRPR